MFPPTINGIRPHICTLARICRQLILHPDTPPVLRREIIKLLRRVKKRAPKHVRLEIEAARVKAVIEAMNDCQR